MELTEEDLLQKHRKEKKDLQAKIQSIKKTSDKKKKKETAEFIAKLENELKIQQQSELDLLKNQLESVNCNEQDDLPNSETIIKPVEQRVSKAQRRRNKKMQNEIENQRRIVEQERGNQFGPRNLEFLAIKELLKKCNLSLYTIPADGDCLYQAINHQLEITGRNAPGVASLRHETAMYMRVHKEEMLPFILSDDGNDIISDAGFEHYCKRIETTKAWGGQVELTALSEILKCKIEVLQASGPSIVLGAHYTEPALILTYHRHMYRLGEHYNSTVSISNDIEVDQDEQDQQDC